MDTFLTKLKSFFTKHKLSFLVLGIVLFIFNCMLLLNGAFPYGEKTLLLSDSFAQIGLMTEHIYGFFVGENSLFYNVKLGGGAEVFSLILYLFLNPFFLLVLPFGKTNIFKSFNFVILVLFIFTAIITMWFIHKHFKNISKIMFVILTIAYTFSSYFLLDICMITWLVFPAVILIIFDKFLELENNGKITGFALSIFWLVIGSFAVGVAANILLLIIFVLHIYLTKEKEKQKDIFVRLLFAYIVAVLLSMCLMLPVVVAILKTNRAGSIFSAIFSSEVATPIMHKLACISLDILWIIFSVYYLFKSDKKTKEFKFLLSAIIVSVMPSIFDAVLCLLFGGYYSGFPARLQFITTAVLFVVTCMFFNEHNIFEKQENEAKSSRLFLGLYIFMIVLFGIALMFFAGFQITKLSLSIKDPTGASSKLYRAVTLISVILVILFLSALLGVKREVLSKKIFRFACCFILIFTTFTNVLLLSISSSTDMSDMVSINTLLNNDKIQGKIKIKQSDIDWVTLDNKIYKQGTLNYFSSTIAAENSAISNLGYYNAPVSALTETGTIIADALVGLKYYVVSEEKERPYLKLIGKENEFFVYENILSTTGALLLDEEIVFDEKDILKSFEDLAKNLGINETLFQDISVKIEEITTIDKLYAQNVYKCSITAPADGILYLKNICLNEQFNDSGKKHISKEFNTKNIYYCEQFSEGQTDIGYVAENKELIAYLTDVKNINDIKFTFLNYNVAEKLCKKLQERQVYFEYLKNGYKISGNSTKNQNLIVFMANINGMHYTMNGKSTEVNSVLGGLVSVSVNAGEFELVAKYSYPYTTIWIVIVIVCLLLLIAVVVLYKFTKFRHIKTFTRGLFLGTGVVFLSIFVLFGIVLTFFKIIV